MKKILISTVLSSILITAINADTRFGGNFSGGHSSGGTSGGSYSSGSGSSSGNYSGSQSSNSGSSKGSYESQNGNGNGNGNGKGYSEQEGDSGYKNSNDNDHDNDGDYDNDSDHDNDHDKDKDNDKGNDNSKDHSNNDQNQSHQDDDFGNMKPPMPNNPINGGEDNDKDKGEGHKGGHSDFGMKQPPKKPDFEKAHGAYKAVILKWKDETDNELGYKVFRDGELIAILPPNTTHFVDKTVEPGKEYDYEIKPFNDFGEGEGVQTQVKTKKPHENKIEEHFKDHLSNFYDGTVDENKLKKMMEIYEEGNPLTKVYKHFFLKDNKDLPNDEFVKKLYETLLGETPDQSTIDDLAEKLKNAQITREELYYDVVTSDDFKNKVKDEGLDNVFEGDENQTKEKIHKISQFVKRFYTELLNRNPEEGGYNYWEQQLANKDLSAKDIAKQFFSSEEFKNKNLSDEDFVKTVYKVIMGREADQGGVDYWTKKLKEGMSRDQVVNEFLNVPEFENLAKDYDIEAKDPVKEFIERFYTKALHRDADPNGSQYWSKELKNAQKTAKEVAKQFFNSKEFKEQNLNDEEFIKTVYQTLMGRDADEGGLEYWKQQLQNGVSREEMIDQFLNSEEFKKFAMQSGVLVDKPSK